MWKTIGFRIINNVEKQQQKDPDDGCCVFPESSYTRILPRAALCEMEREMSALNISAVDYTHYLTLGFESILPLACESVIKLHLYSSQFNVPSAPKSICSINPCQEFKTRVKYLKIIEPTWSITQDLLH